VTDALPTILLWAFVVVAFIIVDIIIVQLVAAARETMRIYKRVMAYMEHPLIAKVEQAERDVERLTAALDALPALQARAGRALTSLRSPRLIVVSRVLTEWRAFRDALGR
jgi:hypothetical protein